MFDIRNSITLLLLILSFFYSSVSSAAPSVGKVLAASGQVSTSSQRTLTRRSDLFSGDTIVTGSNGRVQIQFTDGTLLSLPANTRYRIDSYRYDATKKATNEHRASLIEGGLQTLTGAMVKNSTRGYQIRSNIATIGIRGTFVATALDRNKQVIGVWDGTVDFTQNSCGNSPNCTIRVGDQAASNFAEATTQPGTPRGLPQAPDALGRSEGNGATAPTPVFKPDSITSRADRLNLTTPDDLSTKSTDQSSPFKDTPFQTLPQDLPLDLPLIVEPPV